MKAPNLAHILLIGALLGSVFSLPGCVILHSEKLLPPSKKPRLALAEKVDFAFSVRNTDRYDQGLNDALLSFFSGHPEFDQVVYSEVETTKGLYCEIEIDSLHTISGGRYIWAWVSALTATLIPFYDEFDFNVTFHLFMDGKPVRKFPYLIEQDYYQFIFLLPFGLAQTAYYRGNLKKPFRDQILRTAEMFISSYRSAP